MLSIKQGDMKYYFCIFGMIWPGIELWSPRPLANILTIIPLLLNFSRQKLLLVLLGYDDISVQRGKQFQFNQLKICVKIKEKKCSTFS